MKLRWAWLGACLPAVAIAGCGTAPAPGAGGHSPTAPTVQSSCQRPADDTVTLAGNGKSYCVKVGERVEVHLQGTLSRPWLMPLASSDVLVPVPADGMSRPAGLTGESFAAARPGQVRITSIRRPCVAVMMGKDEVEASGSLPRVYPLGLCPAPGRFSVSVTVLS
jgi:hypothetical protein